MFLIGLLVAVCQPLIAQISPARRPYVTFAVLPTQPDAVYELGQAAAVKVVATVGGRALDNCRVMFEAGADRMPVDTTGVATFCNGEALVHFGTMKAPGFRYCRLIFNVEGENYREQIKVAFAPECIEPTVQQPTDFDDFWRKTLLKAAKVPMVIEKVPVPEYSTERVVCSRVKIQSYEKGFFLCGYLSEPRDEAKHPVLLVPPGAGVKRIQPSNQYAEAGFITLTVGIHGIPMNASDSLMKEKQREWGGYMRMGLDSKELYYYRRVYASMVRAIDYLCSLPNFDGKNVGVTGGSQGGALSIVTAALDKRITFLSAFYPALCDMTGYLSGRAGGWPRFFANEGASPSDQTLETLSYYDVVNFACRIQVPGFYSYGYNDDTCPPTSVSAALNQLHAPKLIEITPSSAHWRFAETNQRATNWMLKQCR